MHAHHMSGACQYFLCDLGEDNAEEELQAARDNLISVPFPAGERDHSRLR